MRILFVLAVLALVGTPTHADILVSGDVGPLGNCSVSRHMSCNPANSPCPLGETCEPLAGPGDRDIRPIGLGVAFTGIAEVEINGGSDLTSGDSNGGFIGIGSASQGTVTVTGPGSTWTQEGGGFGVGHGGTGHLVIEDGATVDHVITTIPYSFVGTFKQNEGTVTIRNGGELNFLASGGPGSSLTIGDGIDLAHPSSPCDPAELASGELHVEGLGSALRADIISVGNRCALGTLRLTNGGLVEADGLDIHGRFPESEGTLEVGDQSRVLLANGLFLGGNDGKATVQLDGGQIESQTAGVGVGHNGTVKGFGTIMVGDAVHNEGIIAPTGVLEITGGQLRNIDDPTGTENGTLAFEIGPTGHGAINITDGPAYLGGALKASLAPGFTPPLVASYQILQANGGVVGEFNPLFSDLPIFMINNIRYTLVPVYGPNTVSLLVTPLPDTDGDGTQDYTDNCIDVQNGGQLDTDSDGFGNACDCDFNQSLTCNIQDFNLFLPDFIATVDSGVGCDMDSNGTVGIDDFNLFLPGFVAGVPGPSGLVP